MEIARTILEQIKYGDKWALMAYGATKYIALQETKDFRGGVKFKVNGLKHKGTVMVQLKWIDTYTIKFVNNNGVAVKEVEDVYCDTLVDVLDYIEGK